MPFVSFSYSIIAMAKTSSFMLSKNGENGYHCLVSDLRRKAFYLSPLTGIFYHEWKLKSMSIFSVLIDTII